MDHGTPGIRECPTASISVRKTYLTMTFNSSSNYSGTQDSYKTYSGNQSYASQGKMETTFPETEMMIFVIGLSNKTYDPRDMKEFRVVDNTGTTRFAG
jgi:hypothetical protein